MRTPEDSDRIYEDIHRLFRSNLLARVAEDMQRVGVSISHHSVLSSFDVSAQSLVPLAISGNLPRNRRCYLLFSTYSSLSPEISSTLFDRFHRKLTAAIGRKLRLVWGSSFDPVYVDSGFNDAVRATLGYLKIGKRIEAGEALLFTITERAATKNLKNQARINQQEVFMESEIIERIPDPAADVGDDLASDFSELIYLAMKNMSPAEKEVFLLHLVQGEEYEEISVKLGVNVETLRARYCRAIDRVKRDPTFARFCPEKSKP